MSTNEAFILDGEGILGLEAACASLTEPGDKVLVIDNGIYGKGFADFVAMYGGQVEFYTAPYTKAIDVEAFGKYLEKNHDFKYATLVHCDTPSGVLNPVEEISKKLHEYGIMTIVDSVSGMFGEPIHVDEGQIDILCGDSADHKKEKENLCKNLLLCRYFHSNRLIFLARSDSHDANSDLLNTQPPSSF